MTGSEMVKAGDEAVVQWRHNDAFRGWLTTPTKVRVRRVEPTQYGLYGDAAILGDNGEELGGCDFYERDGVLYHGGR